MRRSSCGGQGAVERERGGGVRGRARWGALGASGKRGVEGRRAGAWGGVVEGRRRKGGGRGRWGEGMRAR